MSRVILQMGHCFRRTGATGTNGVDGDPNEQEFAQAACYAAANYLRAAGHSPLVIDADEPDAAYRGDAFVAVHCDGSISADARGASVGYRTSEGAHLGAEFKSAYAKRGWVGWRPDNYTAALAGYYGTGAAVRAGNRYALIVESGFLTSPRDEARLSPPDGPDRVARAITEAVVAVFGGAAPAPAPSLDDLETEMPLSEETKREINETVKTAMGSAVNDPAAPYRQGLEALIDERVAKAIAEAPAPNYVRGGGATEPLPSMVGWAHHAAYYAAHYAGAPGFDLAAPPAEDTPVDNP